MNRSDLASNVAAGTSLSKPDAACAVPAVFATIVDALARGETVTLARCRHDLDPKPCRLTGSQSRHGRGHHHRRLPGTGVQARQDSARCGQLGTRVTFPAGRSSRDFRDSSLDRTPAQSRAEIGSPRAQGPYAGLGNGRYSRQRWPRVSFSPSTLPDSATLPSTSGEGCSPNTRAFTQSFNPHVIDVRIQTSETACMTGKGLIRSLRWRAKADGRTFKVNRKRGKGSHAMVSFGERRSFVPLHGGDLPTGTRRAILRQLGVRPEELESEE